MPRPAPPAGRGLPPDPAAALTLARSTGRTVRDGELVDRRGHRRQTSSSAGWCCTGATELSESDQRILERAALVTALLLLIRRTAGEAENRVRGELLEELLTSPRPRPRRAAGAGPPAGHRPRPPQAVVVARVEERARPRALAAATHLAATRGGPRRRARPAASSCACPDRPPGPAAALVHRELTDAGPAPVTVGGRGPAAGPAAVARRARRGGTVRGHPGGARPAGRSAASAEELGLLRSAGRRGPGRARLRRRPPSRRSWTTTRAGAPTWSATLQAYFDAGSSPGPGGRGAARARQHGHPAPGPGRPAARAGTGPLRSGRSRCSWRCGCGRSGGRRAGPAGEPARAHPRGPTRAGGPAGLTRRPASRPPRPRRGP